MKRVPPDPRPGPRHPDRQIRALPPLRPPPRNGLLVALLGAGSYIVVNVLGKRAGHASEPVKTRA